MDDIQADWMPIETAPEEERVLVCGWQPRLGNVAGYWWWDEDVIIEGRAFEHPSARYWMPAPKLPVEPPQ